MIKHSNNKKKRRREQAYKTVFIGLVTFCVFNFSACDEGTPVPYGNDLTGDLNHYFGNFHSHTKYSDGKGTAAEAFAWARDTAQMDFYCITDHVALLTEAEWNDTGSQADFFNQDGVFTAIRGFEWTAMDHANAFMVDSYSGAVGAAGYEMFYDWIDQEMGLAQFNHPADSIVTFGNLKFDDTVDDNFFSIETGNTESGNNSNKYLPSYIKALDNGWKVGPAYNLDNHSLSDLGHRTVVLAQNLSRDDLYDAMKARRFYSSDDPNMAVSFRCNGHWMGQTLTVSESTVQFDVVVNDDEPIIKIQLITRGGAVVAEEVFNSNDVTWSPVVPVTSGNYYFLKVTESNQLDDDDPQDIQVTVTSPIWIIVQ